MNKLKEIQVKIEKNTFTIMPMHHYLVSQKFITESQIPFPFIAWDYTHCPTEIENIFKGKEVTLKTGINEGYSALKFNRIHLEIFHINEEIN